MPDNRRAPAKQRAIEDIDPREDIRVRLLGTVLGTDEDSLMLDDGTGTTEVFLDGDQLESVMENDTIRVIGRVLPTPDGFEIQGEIVQETDVDPDRYRRVMQVAGGQSM